MLSLTCKTAIKAVIYLASKDDPGQKSSIVEISQHIDASEHTVGKLLQQLVKDEIIVSNKGPNGGFFITPKQRKQPLINIVESIDGKDIFKQCGLGLSRCSTTHQCLIHNQWKVVRDQFEKICKENRIIDLCEPLNTGLTHLTG